jgi:hypothetical protein
MIDNAPNQYADIDTIIQKLIGYRKVTPRAGQAMHSALTRAVKVCQFTEQAVVEHLRAEYELAEDD